MSFSENLYDLILSGYRAPALDKKIILNRVRNSKKRPLLNDENPEKIIERLYESRKKFYNNAEK